MGNLRTVILVLVTSIFVPAWVSADGRLNNNDFAIEYGPRGITSLKRVGDAYDTEYLATGAVLGNLVIQYKSRGETAWTVARDPALAADPAPGSRTLIYSIQSAKSSRLKADETFALDGDVLTWTLTLANLSNEPLEIGDLALPLAMAEATPGRGRIYTQKLIRHSFIAGHGSWVYWQRANAQGPFLVMVPRGRTKFEYSGSVAPPLASENADKGAGARRARSRPGFTPFIHAAVSSVSPIAQGKAAGREQPWRLPISSLVLAPNGSAGDSITYSFNFTWARDFNAVREVLYRQGSIDVTIVPGMTLATDLSALIALRTQHHVAGISAEFPDKTKLEFVQDKGNGITIYKVQFARLGENLLTIKYGDERWSTLQFFVTEPLETVISKRSSFLVNCMQHKDSSKWWYGAYSDWDQRHKVLRGPIDRDGLSPWLTDASDDAGNARPAFVASKNAFFPDQKEIDSVELYIKYYLFAGNKWNEGVGGMQMTEKEPYPYGIYGTIDNWHQHRTIDPAPPTNFVPQNRTLSQEVGWARLHREHLWRIYDYPHIMLLYYRMYQIAKAYPTMVHYANADEYLMLAYNTSVAYWTVPMQTDKPHGWPANSVPTMNEAFVPELIAVLQREGKKAEAAKLHDLWNSKVARFVNESTRPNLFGSEFAFDSTGFESTGAMARYAMEQVAKGGSAELYTAEQARKFLEFQLWLNMGDRGWLENTYYQLGSDYRGGLNYLLSYMSPMGGWSILDYGLQFATDPAEYLRLGYASILSSWALVNSGTLESRYGFWWPGKENDGAAGGGFMPEPMGNTWIRKTVPRGAWYYSAEEDVGYCGALRAHATIVTTDPIFGEFAYGAETTRKGDAVAVIPGDGLRARFHDIRDDRRLQMELRGDGYARGQPVVVNDALTSIRFTLENRVKAAHKGQLEIRGLPPGNYTVTVDGRFAFFKIENVKTSQILELPIGPVATANVAIEKAQ
jgi:hypothetical protein